MDKFDTYSRTSCIVIVSFLSYLLGGWDIWLKTLMMFTVVDWVAGLLFAFKSKTYSTDIAFWGGIKKILIYVVVAMAVSLDNLLPVSSIAFRTITIGYYIGVEGMSVIRNLSRLDMTVPKKIIDAIEKIGGNLDKEEQS